MEKKKKRNTECHENGSDTSQNMSMEIQNMPSSIALYSRQ